MKTSSLCSPSKSAQPMFVYSTPQNSIPSISGSPVSETKMPLSCAPTKRKHSLISGVSGSVSCLGSTENATPQSRKNTANRATCWETMGQFCAGDFFKLLHFSKFAFVTYAMSGATVRCSASENRHRRVE